MMDEAKKIYVNFVFRRLTEQDKSKKKTNEKEREEDRERARKYTQKSEFKNSN